MTSITTYEEFEKAISEKLFVDNPDIQQDIFWYVLNNLSVSKLNILWAMQQNYSTIFTYRCLEPFYLEYATVDDLLDALDHFVFIPSSFFEKICAKGDVKQLERFKQYTQRLLNNEQSA